MDAVAGFFSALPEEMRDPVLFAIPCFLLLLILEWTAARKLESIETAATGQPRPASGAYLTRDSVASISMGLVSIATTAGWKSLALLGYAAIYAYLAPWQLSAHRWYTWVPGYHAPPDRTAGVATRVVGAFFDAIAAGIATGDIRLTDDVAPQPMSSDFEKIRQEFGFPGDDRVVTKCFLLWAGVVGAISLEVFGQYGADMLTDPGVVFDAQTRLLVAVLAEH